MLSFTEAIAHEVRNSSISVMAVCPGPVDTEFFQVSDERVGRGRRRDSPARIAHQTLRLLAKRRPPLTSIPGATNWVQSVVAQRLPRRLVLVLAGQPSAQPASPRSGVIAG